MIDDGEQQRPEDLLEACLLERQVQLHFATALTAAGWAASPGRPSSGRPRPLRRRRSGAWRRASWRAARRPSRSPCAGRRSTGLRGHEQAAQPSAPRGNCGGARERAVTEDDVVCVAPGREALRVFAKPLAIHLHPELPGVEVPAPRANHLFQEGRLCDNLMRRMRTRNSSPSRRTRTSSSRRRADSRSRGRSTGSPTRHCTRRHGPPCG